MKSILRILLPALCLLTAVSCIKNDLPYPVEEIRILSIAGNGFTVGANDIDPVTRTVTLHLAEATDIAAVEITSAEITEGGSSSEPLTGVFDLRAPKRVILSRYQDYEWTLAADQPIERYFTVAGQVGTAEIDPADRTATVWLPEGSDLRAVTVTSLKLGPAEVTTMTPSIGELTDFTSVRYVYLRYHGRQERWSLYVRETAVKVQWTNLDLRATIAWLGAAAQEGSAVGFRYRPSGTAEWTEVPADRIEVSGGSFTTKLTGLRPETAYDFVACSDGELSPVETRTTEATAVLPGAGFEEWSTAKDIIYPYAEGAAPFWGSGNPGASIANATLTEGIPDPRPGSAGKLAARLTSKFANIFGIGKFAAGNLFLGTYVRNDGTHGIVRFGRPFVLRPTALRGWMKFNRGTVDRVGSTQPPGVKIQPGDPDCGMIYIALGDWDPAQYGGDAESPVEIRTRTIEQTAFDPHGEAVIAYGELPLTESVAEWTEFTIPLDYRATNRIPTHLIIVCSASRYGDYFTGSSQSVLWVDDFELLWE